jgi:hypothetical protein
MAYNVRTVFSNDYLWFDGFETIRITSKNPDRTRIATVKAVRDSEFDPQITTGDIGTEHATTVFYIWDDTLDEEIHLKGGDRIEDYTYVLDSNGEIVQDSDGNDIIRKTEEGWTILNVDMQLREPRWRVTCVKRVQNAKRAQYG